VNYDRYTQTVCTVLMLAFVKFVPKKKKSEGFLLPNNTGHTSMRTSEAITKFGRRVLPHPLYSCTITFSPLRSLEVSLREYHYADDVALQNAVCQ
jgi:hypothetical protein